MVSSIWLEQWTWFYFYQYVPFAKVRLRSNVSLYYFYDPWARCLICNYIRDSMIILHYQNVTLICLMVSHRTSASFVASCYAFLAATCMLFGLLFQFLLISQNLTSQEFHIASKRNMLRHGLCATKNVYNQGIIHNWFNFWLTGRMDTRTSVISLWCTSLAAFYLLDFISLFWYLFI